MLLLPEFLPEENKAEKKNINGAFYLRVQFDLFPGLFHFGAPVNIIEDQNSMLIACGYQLPEVTDGWLIAVIAVNIGKVNKG